MTSLSDAWVAEMSVKINPFLKDPFLCCGRKAERELLNIFTSSIAPLSEWPAHYKRCLMSDHLKFGHRIGLFLFVIANGAPADALAEWVDIRGMLHDKAARQHMANLFADFKSGKKIGKMETHIIAPTMSGREPEWVWVPGAGKGGRGALLKPAGYGDPVYKRQCDEGYDISNVFPIDFPSSSFFAEEGWRFDRAYSILVNAKRTLPGPSRNVWSIAPAPDAFESLVCHESLDVYGNTFDKDDPIHKNPEYMSRPPTPKQRLSDLGKRAREVSGIDDMFE